MGSCPNERKALVRQAAEVGGRCIITPRLDAQRTRTPTYTVL